MVRGKGLRGKEFFGWVDGKVVCVEEEDGFEGREEHCEDFKLVRLDDEVVRSVYEEVGENDAFCVQEWEDDIADLGFVFFGRGEEHFNRECGPAPPKHQETYDQDREVGASC